MHRNANVRAVVRAANLALALSTTSMFVPPASAALPDLEGLQPLALHFGVNRVPGFAADGRAATLFMAHRENGNAHGYDVLMVSVDAAGAGPGAVGSSELVEVERQGGESPDTIRVEPFDGENAISAIRFARGRLGGAPVMLLIQARRQMGPAAALTDPAPVELRAWRLDGPSSEVGRTPYMFRLARVATTARPYRDAGEALDRELRWSAAAPYANLPSAGRIAADISSFGERTVLRERLWPDQHIFESLLDQIETGDPEWLRIAVALRSVSDAGASEGLSGALSAALAKQPENVLRLLAPDAPGSPFTVAEVCSARFAFIEQPEAERRWRVEAQQSVSTEHDARLTTVRDACLAALPAVQ